MRKSKINFLNITCLQQKVPVASTRAQIWVDEAPKGWRMGKGCPQPTGGEVCGDGKFCVVIL